MKHMSLVIGVIECPGISASNSYMSGRKVTAEIFVQGASAKIIVDFPADKVSNWSPEMFRIFFLDAISDLGVCILATEKEGTSEAVTYTITMENMRNSDLRNTKSWLEKKISQYPN